MIFILIFIFLILSILSLFIYIKNKDKIDNKNLSDIVDYYIVKIDDEIFHTDNNFKKIIKINNNNKLKINNKIYQNIIDVKIKENYPINNKLIPKIIWQTFKEEIKKDNPLYDNIITFKNQKGYEYNFLNDKQGGEFIKNNFHIDVYNAYQILIPGAYKADLLRVCLIYIHGGVYADIKIKLIFPLDYFLDTELIMTTDINNNGIWNGFFASIPNHPFIKKIIDSIVYKVKNKQYGVCDTDITGPRLWQKELNKINLKNYRMMKLFKFKNNLIISNHTNYEPFLIINFNYYKHYKNTIKNYTELWKERKVYNEELYKKLYN